MDIVKKAYLLLADGTLFEGTAVGYEGQSIGEVVFNTGMAGYQEVLTDPSYYGQVVTMTYPLVGNYGINFEDYESRKSWVSGFIMREMCEYPSNWRCKVTLDEYLKAQKVVGLAGIDTRRLTRKLRGEGVMNGVIYTEGFEPDEQTIEEMKAYVVKDAVKTVTCAENIVYPAEGETKYRIALFDYGVKYNIERELCKRGCEVTVVPAYTKPEDVVGKYDGVMLSNGPGDPDTVPTVPETVRAILGKLPVFGICLGNQMITLAAGARVEKLPYGHHGGNEPVMNLLTGKVEITAQNHNYGPVFSTFGPLVPEPSGGLTEHPESLLTWSRMHVAPVAMNERYGRIRLTHVNLNDGTPEGIQFLDLPAFSMQYHPEAKPGPNDSAYMFESFSRLMDGREDYLAIDVREGRRF